MHAWPRESCLIRTTGQGRVEAHQLLGSRQGTPSLSGVLILPASAIHPLLAACSHCSCPLTYHPLKSLLSHSPPVQWTDASQTEEITKRMAVHLACPPPVYSCIAILLLPTGGVLVGQPVRLAPTLPRHGHTSYVGPIRHFTFLEERLEMVCSFFHSSSRMKQLVFSLRTCKPWPVP